MVNPTAFASNSDLCGKTVIMKINIFLLLLLTSSGVKAQFTKDKLTEILCGKDQMTWQVTGINSSPAEKVMTFRRNNTVGVEDLSGKKQERKWTLQSADNIRWFLDFGGTKYEMIVSYNKKGEQYIKLNRKDNGEYELKLTQLQSK
jgi:hypothetical protein